MTDLPYQNLPEAPAAMNASAVLMRLMDGLAFRYRWATEDLRSEDRDFRPSEDCMPMVDLLWHIYHLVRRTNKALQGNPGPEPDREIELLRGATLSLLMDLHERLPGMSDEDLLNCTIAASDRSYPIWNLINGPIADALTHIGQVNSWRRIAGNPTPRADVFRGNPPA